MFVTKTRWHTRWVFVEAQRRNGRCKKEIDIICKIYRLTVQHLKRIMMVFFGLIMNKSDEKIKSKKALYLGATVSDREVSSQFL